MMLALFQATVVDIQGELAKTSIPLDLAHFIEKFAGFGLVVCGLAAFGFFLWGGIQWTLSGGDKGKIEAAKQHITAAIVGLVVTASTFAVFMIVQYVLGINIIGTGGSGGTVGANGGGGTGICTVGEVQSDGGAGGYCTNGGAARMRCVGPGTGPSNFQYIHWEPCECLSGKPKSGYTFMSCYN